MTGPGSPVHKAPGGVRIAVRLTPKAAEDRIGAVADFGGRPVLGVRVRALPDRGAANDALLALMANWLGVSRADLSLIAGGKSRLKSVAVSGDPDRLAEAVARRLGTP